VNIGVLGGTGKLGLALALRLHRSGYDVNLERMTVLLLSINKANKVKESGIKITGI